MASPPPCPRCHPPLPADFDRCLIFFKLSAVSLSWIWIDSLFSGHVGCFLLYFAGKTPPRRHLRQPHPVLHLAPPLLRNSFAGIWFPSWFSSRGFSFRLLPPMNRIVAPCPEVHLIFEVGFSLAPGVFFFSAGFAGAARASNSFPFVFFFGVPCAPAFNLLLTDCTRQFLIQTLAIREFVPPPIFFSLMASSNLFYPTSAHSSSNVSRRSLLFRSHSMSIPDRLVPNYTVPPAVPFLASMWLSSLGSLPPRKVGLLAPSY